MKLIDQLANMRLEIVALLHFTERHALREYTDTHLLRTLFIALIITGRTHEAR